MVGGPRLEMLGVGPSAAFNAAPWIGVTIGLERDCCTSHANPEATGDPGGGKPCSCPVIRPTIGDPVLTSVTGVNGDVTPLLLGNWKMVPSLRRMPAPAPIPVPSAGEEELRCS